jgi:hypothetical protein
MNNRTRSLIAVLIVLGLLLVAFVPTSAKATKTRFTATEYFVEDIEYGTQTFPDGRSKLRDGISVFRFESSDPRIDGRRT